MNVTQAAALTAERLRELLHYSPETGEFQWKEKRRGAKSTWGIGTVDRTGYRRIGVLGRRYLAHRLAWMYVYGEFPPEALDHINSNRLDNRISNLRACSTAQNLWNRPGFKSKSGLKGAFHVGATGKWRSLISKNNRTHFLGTFDTPEEAHAAYVEASKRLHGEFGRTA